MIKKKSLLTFIQRRSRRVSLKGSLRRLLLVAIISIICIFLWLYYADDSKRISFETLRIPHRAKQDMFVRRTGLHVIIFVLNNNIDKTLCYSVGSAYLSGIPVVVAGYQMPYRGFVSKLDFMETVLNNVELHPADVIIALDSDTVFTGVDINPFLDRFLAQSAATPMQLDALAVRQGRAMAPVLFSGDIGCWAPNVFKTLDGCDAGYTAIYNKVRKYATAHPEYKFGLPFDLSPQRHLNAGAIVARVWAYREYLQKARNLRYAQPSRFQIEDEWFSDQAIYAALYLDLITWEVEYDVFSMPFYRRKTARSPYGLHAGLVGLDFANEFTVVRTHSQLLPYMVHYEHWTKYLPSVRFQPPYSHNITDIGNTVQFVSSLYKRAYDAHGDGIYTRLAVPKWIEGRRASGVDHIKLTPPLLALKTRLIDTINNSTLHVFPVIFHAAASEPELSKNEKMEHAAITARWLMPMAFNPKAKQQAMEYLKSVPLFLSTDHSIIRDSYYAKCGFPFEGTVKKL